MIYLLCNILLRKNKLRLLCRRSANLLLFFLLIFFVLPLLLQHEHDQRHQDFFTTKYQGYYKTYPGDNGARESIMSVAAKCSSSCSALRESHAERQTFNTRSTRHIKANSGSGRDKSGGILRRQDGASRVESWPVTDDPVAEEPPSHPKNLYCAFDSQLLRELGGAADSSLPPLSSSLPVHAKPSPSPPFPSPLPMLTRNQCLRVFCISFMALSIAKTTPKIAGVSSRRLLHHPASARTPRLRA
ncbi:hypothetical protein E2C01_060312 [Portunus trituberculatus]|uniref:Uncharacterized protein n=1 Tax=Portunus trituberculatus TaxID=210409 RepID=A0A5B7H8D1_PORTR|nr:hypothetical protein [Portunus trituberculatus]